MEFEAVFDDLLRHRLRPGGRWQWRVFILAIIASNMAWQLFPTFTLLRGRFYCRQKTLERIGYSFEQQVRVVTPDALNAKRINKVPSSCYEYNLKLFYDAIQKDLNSGKVEKAKSYYDFETMKYWIEAFVLGNSTVAVQWREKYFPKQLKIPCKEGMMYNERYTPALSSVTMEFDLVCDREFWKMYTKVSDVLATMLGFLVGSVLSDRHGRKKIAMIFGSASFVFAIGVAVSTSIQVFVILRAIAAFLIAATHVSTDVLICEVTDRRFRNIFIVLQSLYYNIIVAGSYTLGAYMAQDWRFLQLLVALPAAVSAMFGWFIEESPRWLLSKGKNIEARQIIEKAILTNKKQDRLERVVDMEKIPDCYIDLSRFNKLKRERQRQLCCSPPQCCRKTKYKVQYLFCHRILLTRTVICFIAYLCVMFCRSDQEYRLKKVGRMNYFASYFYTHLTVVPFAVAALLAYHFFDRRRPLIALAVMACLSFSAEGFIQTFGDEDPDPEIVELSDLFHTFVIINQFFLFGCTVILSEMTALRIIELFPTEVRNSAFGLSKGIGCGALVAGYAMKEYEILPNAYMRFCFGGSALVVAFMIFLTPASEDGHLLLDTVEQLNHRIWETKEKRQKTGRQKEAKKRPAKTSRRKEVREEGEDSTLI